MNLEQNIIQVPIEEIIPNRFQPRLNFDDRGLEELANSIKQHGIIQPLVLRRVGDKYEIIAGERRFKAAGLAGLTTVPGIIAQIDDNKSAEVAIVENVQRRDLSAIEEARSYRNLLDNHEDQKIWLDKIIKERLTVRELDEALKKETNKNPEDDTDIPLVKPLDIEAIKEGATELPSVNADSDIARRIQEIEREKMNNPDVIPVEQATNDSKNNFFNFLENETVNMNVEENNVETPNINFNNQASVNELSDEQLKTPIIDLNPSIQNIEPTEPEVKPEPVENPINLNNENNNSNVFDPTSLIERLSPDYEEKVEQTLGIDLKTAINSIRNVKDELSMKGFNISLEETDLDDSYQFTIKIKKE